VSAALTPAVLRPLLEELHRTRPDEPLIGVQLDGAWDGGDYILLGGQERPVRVCRAPLDVRVASAEQDELGAPLVVLTPLSDRQLGLDLTARFAGQRLLRPSLARAVMQLFEAHDLDRRIAREGWLLRALLEYQPAAGYGPVPSGALTAERAWDELLRATLDLPGSAPTLRELLIWSQDPKHLANLWATSTEVRDGVRGHLAVIPGVSLLLGIAEHAHAPDDVLAVVAALSVLVASPNEPATLLAAGRIAERNLGGRRLDLNRDARALVLAAELIVRDQQRSGIDAAWQRRAHDLTVEFDLTPLVGESDMLDDAWSARLTRFADALSAALVASDGPEDDLAAADAAVRRHVRAAAEDGVLASLTAMSRLVRWINQSQSPAATTLSAAVRDEVRDGGWVARARAEITSSGAPELANAAQALAEAVDARRTTAAIAFAAAAVRWDGEPSDNLIGVEHVLDRVVAPVARATPILVVVLDGVSLAVLRGLLGDLEREGWVERRPAAMTGRPVALAVLPSLTTLSRSSLLSGRLVSGGQAEESSGFAAHAGLREAGTAGGVPLLLHKRELSDDGATLSTAVRDEIFGTRRVVGLVINAIDDELSGAVQRHGHWSLRDIPLLDAALSAAREAARAVVLLSDHGHVPERTQTQRVAKGSGVGDRHRPAGGDAPDAGEVLAEGRRVLVSEGRVILAADPNIRYTAASKPGYHGGASPEELVAPIAVITAFDTVLDGLVDQESDEPAWWRQEVPSDDAVGPVAVAPPSRHPPGRSTAVSAQQTIFDELEPELPITRSPAEPAWVHALLASEVFTRGRERAGRGAPSEDRVRALLSALGRHDGRLSPAALAVAAEVPAGRLDGLLAALRPLINVDGYPILTVDRDAELVELRIADLRRQFGI
jgi:hypothetical protein